MGNLSEQGSLSRRKFLGNASRAFALGLGFAAAGGAVFGASKMAGKAEWLEIVQDMNDGNKWHVNKYAGSRLGDLESGRLVEHSEAGIGEVETLRKRNGPARIQFSTGHQEIIGMA